jgi:copper chaperone NosL
MRTLHEKDFMEFLYLPYVLGLFAALCLLVAAVGKRLWLIILFGLYALFAVVAMMDFWHWEYNYGHNLSPEAPIKVPGMTYQPPLIGYKQLLNFGAYSIPDTGGWLMALAGLLLVVCTYFAFRKKKIKIVSTAVPLLALMALSSCASGPVPIKVGIDNCDFCKMSVADPRFGAEVLNTKGKAWKFDDVHCLVSFLKEGTLKAAVMKDVYFVRFDGVHELLPAGKALLLQSEALHSPMGSNVAAFGEKGTLDKTAAELGGKEVKWEELKP